MKKIILLLLFVPVIGFSQLIYTDEIKNAPISTPENFQDKEVWRDWKIIYTMKFEKTPIGVKHLFEITSDLLKLNNFEFDKPDRDKTYLASYSKDINDYETLNAALKLGDSEIDRKWSKGIGKYISIILNKSEYIISVTKP